MWKKFWFPPLKASGFRFHFLLREPPDLRVLGGHGAAGRVRSPARAAGGLGFPSRGKPAALGPRSLQFLSAISGARPPPGNAGQGCKEIPWEAGRREQSNGGSALRLSGVGEMRRGPSFSLAEPRPGSRAGAREEATWDLGAGRLRVRRCRLGQRKRGERERGSHRETRELSCRSPSQTNHQAFLMGLSYDTGAV